MSRDQSRISSMETVRMFLARGTCSQTLAGVLNRAFENPLKEEERASDPLAGGIAQHGYQCGMIWGAVLAAGAEVYRRFGAGPHAEARAILAAQRIVRSFQAQNKEINCVDLTGLQETSTPTQQTTYFFLKGGVIGCFRMASRYAPVAYNEINAALSEEHVEVHTARASCAAELARKTGASDMHVVMAAGFAGGIGLSGGACGALGAAIWIAQMNASKEGRKVDYKPKEALDLIGKFVKCTGYEFECSKIVGRKFESVADHARHVCDGGCSKIVDVLASSPSACCDDSAPT